MFKHLRDVIAVAAPGLLRHLPSISNLDINRIFENLMCKRMKVLINEADILYLAQDGFCEHLI